MVDRMALRAKQDILQVLIPVYPGDGSLWGQAGPTELPGHVLGIFTSPSRTGLGQQEGSLFYPWVYPENFQVKTQASSLTQAWLRNFSDPWCVRG